VYYLLYDADRDQMPSKVAIDPEDSKEPSLGRIRADSVAPPHTPTSIKRCISRVEKNPALAWHADLFEVASSVNPLKKGHISLRTDGPGMQPDEAMAIVLSPPIPDGKYLVKNRAGDVYWSAGGKPITTVYFFPATLEFAKEKNYLHVNEHFPIIQVFRG
jgi:hypothetical protein